MNYITDDIMLTSHFDAAEFKCKCGCGLIRIDKLFVERMEKMYSILSKAVNLKAIIINSGYRCNKCSSQISGAFIGDMHNKGGAADIHALFDTGKNIDALTLCEAAQRAGFGGIAVIDDYNIHIDDRQRQEFNYSNRCWYGNEKTGFNYSTFIGKSPYTKYFDEKENEKYFEIIFDGKKFTGYLIHE